MKELRRKFYKRLIKSALCITNAKYYAGYSRFQSAVPRLNFFACEQEGGTQSRTILSVGR